MKFFDFVLLSLFLSSPILSIGQNHYQQLFFNDADLQTYNIQPTSDDGYLLSGIAEGDASQVFLAKVDCKGEVEWKHGYGISSTMDNASHAVTVTPSGEYLLATNIGRFQNFDIQVSKISTSGTTLWQKTLEAGEGDYVRSIAVDASGEIYLAGGSSSFQKKESIDPLERDIFITKLDLYGNPIWARTFGDQNTKEEASQIIITSEGILAITGTSKTDNNTKAFLLQLNLDGEMKNFHHYGNENANTIATSLIQAGREGFYITGSTVTTGQSKDDYTDLLLIKTNNEGTINWAKTYTGTAYNKSDIGTSLTLNPEGGVVIGASTNSFPTPKKVPSKFWVLEASANGTLNKSITLNQGNAHYPILSKAKNGNGYLIAGFSSEHTDHFSTLVYKTGLDLKSGGGDINRLNLTEEKSIQLAVSDVAPDQFWHATTWSEKTYLTDLTIDTKTLRGNHSNAPCGAPMPTEVWNIETPQPRRTVPVPSDTEINIEMNLLKNSKVEIEIFSPGGESVYLQKDKMALESERLTIQHKLTKGEYLLRLEINNKPTFYKLAAI